MKTSMRHAVTPLILAVVCQTGLAFGGDVHWISGDSEMGNVPEYPQAVEEVPLPRPIADALLTPPGTEGEWFAETASAFPAWTLDYRARGFFDSHTSYEFGTPSYSPASKLDWSLDSKWHGFEVGLETPTSRIFFEWLTPIERGIDGNMADYDWLTPSDPSQLDSLTLSSLRWREGQMIDFGGMMQMTNHFFGWPIEIWPMLGFRWQRFSMTGTGVDEIVPPNGPDPAYEGRDMITFSQQYYIFYIGGQLRTNVRLWKTPVAVTFQGDWGGTWGYNSDHHLWYEDYGIHRYTMESTSGGSTHLAFIAEAPVGRRFSVGLRIEHLAIYTTGSHRWVMSGATTPVDERWTNGVIVNSDQTSLTAYARVRF